MSAPPRPGHGQPWRIIVFAVGGLLAAIVLAGSVGLALMGNVGAVTDRALHNDLILEDEADDLRIAVLDLRHFQRNIFFSGPSRNGMAEWEGAYRQLLERIEVLRSVRILSLTAATPDELQATAQAYFAEMRPAMELYVVDRGRFDAAHEAGLARLVRLDQAAEGLDKLGEAQAAAALRDVEQATDTATFLLLLLVSGAGAAGLALAWAALRVLGELRAIYAAEQESGTRLEAALRAKTAFVADASHELRTPLTVLRGNAEVGLALPSDRACGHEDVLREIVREAVRMTHLVEDLLFLARSDTGSVPLDIQDVAVEPWLAEVAARAEILARERGARLQPRVAVAATGRFDAERIEQAILVLVDNAAKYSPPGALVRLSARVAGDRLVVEVADSGPGIAEADLQLVFERFHRGDKTRPRGAGGAGLGLSIARAILEAHDGRIVPKSEPGVGTRMTMVLPFLARPHEAPDPEHAEASSPDGAPGRPKSAGATVP